ncbi:MAG: GNAT family N-acetyltransferase [Verrucomicrobia bacterium]|nr:GNAT family N-acetyltransferase [Verrucomicrobiota bacterium]
MIVRPLDEVDRETVLSFLLPDLVRNGALIADCTVLHDLARAFVAERGGVILGVMAQIGTFVGLRTTSENVFRKLLEAHGGTLVGHTLWSLVHAEELAHIAAQAQIEWTEPMCEMVYEPIMGSVEPPASAARARKLTVADLGLMREFYKTTGVLHWTPDMLQRGPAYSIIDDESPARSGGLAAVAGSYFVTDWLGEIGMVGVLPRYRRRGYGTLVSHLVTQDILRRAKKACLHVAKADHGPHEMYLKMGYRDAGEGHLAVWHV